MSETTVKQSGQFPKYEHFAVLIYTSYSSPGYDPGEPSYSSPMVEYLAFKDEQAFVDWVKYNDSSSFRKSYTPLFARPVLIERKISVAVK